MKRCIIMQGLPGSGKSTLATRLAAEVPGAAICSADHYMITGGRYKFALTKVAAAHNYCQSQAYDAMMAGCSLVVIDNTNIRAWEAKEYVLIAMEHGYDIEFRRPNTEWAFDVEECFKRNQHGCPKEVIVRMNSRIEDLTIVTCLEAKSPWEQRVSEEYV